MPSHPHTAFFILAPDTGNTALTSQSGPHRTLSIAVLPDMASAHRLAKELAQQGVTTIELSASFGDEGEKDLREIAGREVKVGRVHFPN